MGANPITLNGGCADLSRGLNHPQILGTQAGRGSVGSDIDQLERLSSEQRQAQGTAQYLAAAFAQGAIDFNHELSLPPTTCCTCEDSLSCRNRFAAIESKWSTRIFA